MHCSFLSYPMAERQQCHVRTVLPSDMVRAPPFPVSMPPSPLVNKRALARTTALRPGLHNLKSTTTVVSLPIRLNRYMYKWPRKPAVRLFTPGVGTQHGEWRARMAILLRSEAWLRLGTACFLTGRRAVSSTLASLHQVLKTASPWSSLARSSKLVYVTKASEVAS